jgi:hypothetical protein
VSLATDAVLESFERLRLLAKANMTGLMSLQYQDIVDEGVEAMNEHLAEWFDVLTENDKLRGAEEEREEDFWEDVSDSLDREDN